MTLWSPHKPLFPGLVLVAIAAASACSEAPAPKAVGADPAPGKGASEQSKTERQGELVAKADGDLNAGEVEPAIAGYIDAEKLGALPPDVSKRFAGALKLNGDAVVAAGEDVPRGMTNYIKALTLDAGVEGLGDALLKAADKLDEGDGLRAEQVIEIYLEEHEPELTPEATAALAEFFRGNGDRLLDTPWAGQRIYRSLERADKFGLKSPALEQSWKQAAAKLDKELADATKIKKAVDARYEKHPAEDGIEQVAKRRDMSVDDVRTALELIAFVQEDQAKQLANECGPKPSCGGLDGGCQGDETAFKDDVEVSSCTKPTLVEGKCWVVECDVKAKRTGKQLGRYELSYKKVQGVPMPVTAARVGG